MARPERREMSHAVEKRTASEGRGDYLLLPGFCPFAHCSSVFQSGSSLDSNCLPPLWKELPPASGASGMNRRRLAAKLPGTTSLETVSKLRRDPPPRPQIAPGRGVLPRGAVLFFPRPKKQDAGPGAFLFEAGALPGL